MTLFFFTVLASTFLYSTLIILHWYGWSKVFKKTNQSSSLKGISIIVPFRNEAKNLATCEKALMALDYPTDLFEIIFVNDHSSDESTEKLILSKSTLLHLNENEKGKKAALTKGIKASKFDIVITLDADSIVPASWLHSMMNKMQENNYVAVAGMLKFKEEDGFLNAFLNVEMASVMGITAGGINLGFPVLANGTNFLFSKKAFEEVGGYEGDRYASGDDVFLVQKLVQMYGAKSLAFNSEASALVLTLAPLNVKKLIHQRLRWAGKAKGYRLYAKTLTYFIGAYNCLMAVLLASCLFATHLLPFVLAMFITKTAMDTLLTLPVLLRTKQDKLILFIPLVALIYPFYIIVLSAVSTVVKPKWKGREV